MDLQKELQRTDLSFSQVYKRVLRFSTAAGNGVGKTSIVAWLIHWFISVYPNGEAVITAGTEAQLQGKTWREVAKWQLLACNGWQMKWTAEKYSHNDAPKTWFAEARAWSEANPQAMAGTHENYVLVIFDEASGISPLIWDAIEGAMTTGLVLFFAFGNPSEDSGGFWETQMGKTANRWHRRRVDAREVSFANLPEINGWIEDQGLDSDFVRVHVLGMFPKQANTSLISTEVVASAVARVIQWKDIPRAIPRLMGCDIARQGVDSNTIIRRQGRKVAPDIMQWHERDTMATANYIARQINEWHPDMVFIDGVGVGAGVVDYLRMRGYERIVIDVQSGMRPDVKDEAIRYGNMRAVCWYRMLEWLRTADLPPDQELMEELCQPKYKFEVKTDRVFVESKMEMRKRGVRSPNKADALAYTFYQAIPVLAGGARFAEPDAV